MVKGKLAHQLKPAIGTQARKILSAEAEAILRVSRSLDSRFELLVNEVLACRGIVFVSGMGKAGLIGQKIAATLASTGTSSLFLHPAEAIHGDLGRVGKRDIVLVLSYSGETTEILRLVPALKDMSKSVMAITRAATSSLGKACDFVVELGEIEEAGHLGLAPSSTTTAMLALGDALALVVSQQRGFKADDFARNHPGGSLGLKLASVDSIMRPLKSCRLASDQLSVREVIVSVSRPGRRCGAIMMLGTGGRLTGIFTDSDLARLLERRGESLLDRPISQVMTKKFATITTGAKLKDAIQLMAEKKFSELPVLDEEMRPIGMIDITDIMGLYSSSQGVDEESPGATSVPRPHVRSRVRSDSQGRHTSPATTIPLFRKTA